MSQTRPQKTLRSAHVWIQFEDTPSRELHQMNRCITMKEVNPIAALRGIVSIQAHRILRATLHFTALVPMVDPTPIIEHR